MEYNILTSKASKNLIARGKYNGSISGSVWKSYILTPSKTTTTTYLGGMVYENDVLQFMAHEERQDTL